MKKKILLIASMVALLTATGIFVSCDDDGDGLGALGDIAEQCGLTCYTLEGDARADITGNASIDAFFDSVLTLKDAAVSLEASYRAELEGLAAALGVEGAAELSISDLKTEVMAKLEAKMSASVDGKLTLVLEPPKCEANLDIAVDAAAKCDAEVEPGKVEAKCEGSCEVNASASCEGSCSVSKPSFECSGECKGKCEATVAAECKGGCEGTCQMDFSAGGECGGTCKGECEGECSVEDGEGNCEGECDGECTGTCEIELTAEAKCEGKCEGSCNVEAGASCEGKCTGECTFDPGGAECEGSCKAEVSGECEGSCSGTAEPPKVKAECEASVNAKANANVECTPPQISLDFAWKAGVSADAKAEFEALLPTLKARFAAMIALSGLPVPGVKADGKVQILIGLFGDMVAAAGGAVEAAVSADISDPIDAFKLACGVAALPGAKTMLTDAQASVTAVLNIQVDLFTSIVGGSKSRAEW